MSNRWIISHGTIDPSGNKDECSTFTSCKSTKTMQTYPDRISVILLWWHHLSSSLQSDQTVEQWCCQSCLTPPSAYSVTKENIRINWIWTCTRLKRTFYSACTFRFRVFRLQNISSINTKGVVHEMYFSRPLGGDQGALVSLFEAIMSSM